MSVQPIESTNSVMNEFHDRKNYSTIRYFVQQNIETSIPKSMKNSYEMRGGHVMLSFINQFILNAIGREISNLLLDNPTIRNQLLDSIYETHIEYVYDAAYEPVFIQSLIAQLHNSINPSVYPIRPTFDFWMTVKAFLCKKLNLDYEMCRISFITMIDLTAPRNIPNAITTHAVHAMINYYDPNNPTDIRNNIMFTFKLFSMTAVQQYVKRNTNTINDYIINETSHIINTSQIIVNKRVKYQQILLLLNAMHEGCLNLSNICNYTDTFNKFLHDTRTWEYIRRLYEYIRTKLIIPKELDVFYVFTRITGYDVKVSVNDIDMFDKIFNKTYNQIIQTSTNLLTIHPSIHMSLPNHPVIEHLLPYMGKAYYVNGKWITPMLPSNTPIKKRYNTYIDAIKTLDQQQFLKRYTWNTYNETNDYGKDVIYTPRQIDQQGENTNMAIYNISKELLPHHHVLFETLVGTCRAYRRSWYIATGPRGGYYELRVGDEFIEPTILSCGLEKEAVIFGERFVRFEIEFDVSSQYILVTNYSAVSKQKEVIFPAGSRFKVTEFIETEENGNYMLIIKMRLTGCIEYSSMQEFGRKYREFLFERGTVIIPDIQNIPNITDIAILKQLYDKPEIFTQTAPIAEIDPMNPNDPYETFHHIKNYTKFPNFDTDQAYIGENLVGDKSDFCFSDYIGNIPNNIENNFNIMTFNVHNFVRICPPTGRNLNHFINFMKSVVSKTQLDVVCLQEVVPVYDKQPHTDEEIEKGSLIPLIDAMKNLGFEYYVCTNTTWDSSRLPYGNYVLANCIFTRYKLELSEHIGLPDNRCVQIVKINKNGLNHIIVNTHLEYNFNKLDQMTENILQMQINCIRNVILPYVKLYPVFITGDFNHDIIKNTMFSPLTSMCTILSPTIDDNSMLFTGFNSGKIIDYVLMTNNTNSLYELYDKVILRSDISDHYPVLVSVRRKTQTINIIPKNKTDMAELLKRKIINWIMVNRNLYENIKPFNIGNTNDCDIIISSEIIESEIAPFYLHKNNDKIRNIIEDVVKYIQSNTQITVIVL